MTYLLRTLILVLSLASVTAACSRAPESAHNPSPKQLSGVYVNETGVIRFHFADGRVRMTGGIVDFENSYEVENDTVWITTADGKRKGMTIRDDGSLTGELGILRSAP